MSRTGPHRSMIDISDDVYDSFLIQNLSGQYYAHNAAHMLIENVYSCLLYYIL